MRPPQAARCGVLLLLLVIVSGQAAFAEPRQTTIGTSQSGALLTLYSVGSGPRRVLILGGQHGGPEVNTVELVGSLLDYYVENTAELPPGIQLDVLPVANPDGLAHGNRQFDSGVDPNRNWGGTDWRSDAYDSNAVFRPGLGGPEPFSEQETRALADWILTTRPVFIVNYHSAGGFMFGQGGSDLARAYAAASGYPWPTPGGGIGQRSPLPLITSGTMNTWLREMGIPAILVELSTPRSTDSERNLAGLQAALAVLGLSAN